MVTNDEGRAAREAKLEYLHDTLATTVEALVSAEDWVRAPGPRAEARTRRHRVDRERHRHGSGRDRCGSGRNQRGRGHCQRRRPGSCGCGRRSRGRRAGRQGGRYCRAESRCCYRRPVRSDRSTSWRRQ